MATYIYNTKNTDPSKYIVCPLRIVLVQLVSCVRLFVTPWTVAHQAPVSSIVSWSLLKFVSIDFMYRIVYSTLYTMYVAYYVYYVYSSYTYVY